MEHLLKDLTRKQRSIYEIYEPLFEAIFNDKSLRHVDPDILEKIEIEQKEYLINELITSNYYRDRHNTLKGARKEVASQLATGIPELVAVVHQILNNRGKEVKA